MSQRSPPTESASTIIPRRPCCTAFSDCWEMTDIYLLARRFGKDLLLARTAQIDAGLLRRS